MSTVPGDRAEQLWVVDDLPSRRFPIYTRGNTGEVYPNVITPLCGSVVKEPIARGQELVFREMGAVVPADLAEADRAVLTGCFGGYLYANLSIGRLLGARTPGMKPADVDTQMFGTSEAPPYRAQRGDRNPRASMRLAAFMARVVRGADFGWLRDERAQVDAWARAQPEPRGASVEQLLTTVDQGAARLTPLMRSLVLASVHGGMASALTDRMSAKSDDTTRAKVSVGVGQVESAEPAAELWRIAQLVNATPAVTSAFDGRGAIADQLHAMGAPADEVRAAFGAFLDRFGSRGPDEWELASQTWGTDPDIALAAVERIRRSDADDPLEVRQRLAAERAHALETVLADAPRPTRPMLRRFASMVARGAAGRELAKGTIVLALYPMRLALFELVRRAQDAGGPDDRLDCWLVTRDEIADFVARPAGFRDIIDERRARRDLLQSRVPPFVFEGVLPDPTTWARRDDRSAARVGAGAVLTGMGVSPGTARGAARVIRDPARPDVLEPGDVLVAPITDPAWTPLFLVASAVVCEVGANMSHAAIVARELGIPAVVSVADATRQLGDGDEIEVDGTAGTVTVLGRAPA